MSPSFLGVMKKKMSCQGVDCLTFSPKFINFYILQQITKIPCTGKKHITIA